MKNLKLIQWPNGTYGVRSGWFFYKFRDFRGNFWWDIHSNYIGDCQTNKERATNFISDGLYRVVNG